MMPWVSLLRNCWCKKRAPKNLQNFQVPGAHTRTLQQRQPKQRQKTTFYSRKCRFTPSVDITGTQTGSTGFSSLGTSRASSELSYGKVWGASAHSQSPQPWRKHPPVPLTDWVLVLLIYWQHSLGCVFRTEHLEQMSHIQNRNVHLPAEIIPRGRGKTLWKSHGEDWAPWLHLPILQALRVPCTCSASWGTSAWAWSLKVL